MYLLNCAVSLPRRSCALLAAIVLSACGGASDAPATSAVSASATYLLGGTLSGLADGASITLLNGDDKLTLSANGQFSFPAKLAAGTAYKVELQSAPGHACRLQNQAAMIANADVTALAVSCLPYLLAGQENQIQQTNGLAYGKDGSLFIADKVSQVIWKVAPSGAVTALAGHPGGFGHDDGIGAAASFRMSQDSRLLLDRDGSLIVGDSCNGLLRRVTMDGQVSTVAGRLGQYCGSLVSGGSNPALSIDGRGAAATFAGIYGVALDNNGDYLVGDFNALRRVTRDGRVSTISYTARPGKWDNTEQISGLAVAQNGDIVFAKKSAHVVFRIHAGVLENFSGSGITPVGTGDGIAKDAAFWEVRDVIRDATGNFYISDGSALRKITAAGAASTVAGKIDTFEHLDGLGAAARLMTPGQLALHPDGSLALGDLSDGTVRLATLDGAITTLTSTPMSWGSRDGVGAAARLRGYEQQPAVDSLGNVYVSDANDHVIRKITPAGQVSLYAGIPGKQGAANGALLEATFNQPFSIAIDRADNLYITDRSGVRKISGNTVSLLATFSDAHFDPIAIAVDGQGNLAVSDISNLKVLGVSPSGQVRVLADYKTAAALIGADNLFTPTGLAYDKAGNLFVADFGSSVVHKLDQAGHLSVFAGSLSLPGDSDGAPGTARLGFYNFGIMTIDADDNLYLAGQGPLRKITPAGVLSSPQLAWGPRSLIGVAYSKGLLYGLTSNAVWQVALP